MTSFIGPPPQSKILATPMHNTVHLNAPSGVNWLLGARGGVRSSDFFRGADAPDLKGKVLWRGKPMPKQVGDKKATVCYDRLLSAHPANFIIPTFVLASHETEAVLRPPRVLRRCLHHHHRGRVAGEAVASLHHHVHGPPTPRPAVTACVDLYSA